MLWIKKKGKDLMIHWVGKQTKLLTDPKFSSSQVQWQSIHEAAKLGGHVLGQDQRLGPILSKVAFESQWKSFDDFFFSIDSWGSWGLNRRALSKVKCCEYHRWTWNVEFMTAHSLFLYHTSLPLFHEKDISMVLLKKNGPLKDREVRGCLPLP